ncbi:MAG TPA: NUDIX domain-containing protein [Negativicutes bacterium]
MPLKVSAGLMMYRWNGSMLEILLSHPGGPLYVNKDYGYWGIPKGHVEPNETVLATAFREFSEETGLTPQIKDLLSLGKIIERSGKVVHAWAFQGECDTNLPVESNLFQMEWPPQSGNFQWFPEVDCLEFYDTETARRKIDCSQVKFIDQLEKQLLFSGRHCIAQ